MISRSEVVQEFNKSGMVAVFYHPDLELCKKVLKACYDGGLRIFEFTNRGKFAHEIFASLKKYVDQCCPDMILGAGSVIDAPTTALYLQEGAQFIVSPVVNAKMAEKCNSRNIAWMPGCGTVTEIHHAQSLGADIVKIFPGAQVGGPGFIKAVLGPLPWSQIMPTGGVSPTKENLEEWLKAGACCVGMGSKLFPKEEIQSGDYQSITDRVKMCMNIIKDIRNEKA